MGRPKASWRKDEWICGKVTGRRTRPVEASLASVRQDATQCFSGRNRSGPDALGQLVFSASPGRCGFWTPNAPWPDVRRARPHSAEVALLRPYFAYRSLVPNGVQATMRKARVWI